LVRYRPTPNWGFSPSLRLEIRIRMKRSDIDAITTPGMQMIERGLYLKVRCPTARSWVLRYRFAGQQRDLELGSAFDVSLVKARDLRDDARTLMRRGSLTPIMRYL
jgi:hypothetical protein